MLELICLLTVKWFQVFLSNTDNSIQYQSFVCTQLSSFKYSYQTPLILFNMNHLFVHTWNGFKYCYLTFKLYHQMQFRVICRPAQKKFKIKVHVGKRKSGLFHATTFFQETIFIYRRQGLLKLTCPSEGKLFFILIK